MKKLRPLLFLLFLAGCRLHASVPSPQTCLELPPQHRQAVVAQTAKPNLPPVTVHLYEKDESGWQQVGSPIMAIAGRNGLAAPGEKREGDGRTPSGVFDLERGFGYEPLETKIPYLVLSPDMIWIDDPRSPQYNRLVTRKEGDDFSHEIMRRKDDLYKYGIVIEYNTKETIPGAGSAIFFHAWRSPQSPTSGCIATSESDVVRLLQWLDPDKKPVAVIGNEDSCR